MDTSAAVSNRLNMLTFVLLAATLSGIFEPRADSAIVTNSSRVLIIQNRAATRAFSPQPGPIREMVKEGITRFSTKPTAKAAWLSLVTTQDIIGLKVFSAPGRDTGTRPTVVAAFVESLLEAGIPASHIIIWDRRDIDLRLAHFHELADRYGVTVTGAVDEGFDEKYSYPAALVGKLVYGDIEFGRKGEGVGRKSYVTKLLTQRITKIINITPLLNHNFAGVSGALYGLALSSVDNTLRFEESQRLATAVPEIYALPEIGDKVVLNVVDALICQYEGEERTRLQDSSALNELWFSLDPVAVDVLALQALEKEKGTDKRRTPAKEIYSNAGLMELGTSDPNKIQVERVRLK
jgi:hypothetical protein